MGPSETKPKAEGEALKEKEKENKLSVESEEDKLYTKKGILSAR